MIYRIVKIDKLSGLVPNFYMFASNTVTNVLMLSNVISVFCLVTMTLRVILTDNFEAKGKRNYDVIN